MPRKGKELHATKETALRLANRENGVTASELAAKADIGVPGAGQMLLALAQSGELDRRKEAAGPTKKNGQRRVVFVYRARGGTLFDPVQKRKPRGRGVAVRRHLDKNRRLEEAAKILFPDGIKDMEGFISWMDYTREIMDG